jgi:hypothetical protein
MQLPSPAHSCTHHNAHTFACSPCSTELPIVLGPASPSAPYRRRTGEDKPVVHWGQRKLFVSELQFLTAFAHAASVVVYVGAAPGTHIPYLADLFPGLRYLLYDPVDFNCRAHPRISVRAELFTDETVATLKHGLGVDEQVLLISDIRSVDWRDSDPTAVEAAVAADMAAQARWLEAFGPSCAAALLKFRLPWSVEGANTACRYLCGRVLLPVWSPPTSSEARLVVMPDRARGTAVTCQDWDARHYGDQMFAFQTQTRLHCYALCGLAASVARAGSRHGVDCCFDCAAEVAALSGYLHSKICGSRSLTAFLSAASLQLQPCVNCKLTSSPAAVAHCVARMMERVSAECSRRGRTLASQPTEAARRAWFPVGKTAAVARQHQPAMSEDAHSE